MLQYLNALDEAEVAKANNLSSCELVKDGRITIVETSGVVSGAGRF
jgi:hypothetical protein